MDAIASSSNTSTLDVSFWEDVLVRTVTTVAWLAISSISFYFAALVGYGVIPIASPLLANIAIGTAVTLGCISAYLAFEAAFTPIEGSYYYEYDTNNNTETSTRSRSSTGSSSSSKSSTRKTNNEPKFEDTLESGNGLKDSIAKALCSYDSNGKVDSDSRLHKTLNSSKALGAYLAYIARTSKEKNLPTDPSFFEITEKLGDVRADGNCGYYSLFCIWVYHAYEDAAFRENLLQKIEEAFPAGKSITLFNKKYSEDDLAKLKDEVLEIFRKIPEQTTESILSERNGKKLNEFMRAAILANDEKLCTTKSKLLEIAEKDVKLVKLSEEEIIGSGLAQKDIGNEDKDDDGSPLDKIASNHAYMTEAASGALCYLFDTEIKTISFLTKVFPNPQNNKKPIEIDSLVFPVIPDGGQKKPIIGYLVFTGGHYIFALPRKEKN